jgi:hypothetical protein
MSTLVGVLSLTGKGGSLLFVFDDALVRAATGMGLVASLLRDTARGREAAADIGEVLSTSLKGDIGKYATMTPEEIARESPGNSGVWVRDVVAASLARGRWPTTGLRRLTLTLNNGESRTLEWAGDEASRPLNRDRDAVALLTLALGPVLDVQLKGRST